VNHAIASEQRERSNLSFWNCHVAIASRKDSTIRTLVNIYQNPGEMNLTFRGDGRREVRGSSDATDRNFLKAIENEKRKVGAKMLEVKVVNVAMDIALKTPVVLLKEKEGDKKLPIWMELPEARTIVLAMGKTLSSFPSTYDFPRRLIEKLNGQVEKVIIDELKNNIYYAKVFVRIKSEVFEVDARPSDAIALALKFKAPIYIDEEKICTRGKPINDEEVNEFKKILKDIKPEDFAL